VFENEQHRVAHYLHSSSKEKLLETVQYELLSRYETQLLEKQDSGCDVLLRDDKKDDVSRMYRLFCRIPKGLEPVASIFKQHVTSQGIALIEWAETVVADAVTDAEHEFVQKVIEMYDKYLDYAKHAFQNDQCIHKALKEAFLVICNKRVRLSTIAELLAAFCDNVLKKASIGKMTDDDIESIFEKIVTLVGYVSDKDLFREFGKKISQEIIV
jgi:cullin 1